MGKNAYSQEQRRVGVVVSCINDEGKERQIHRGGKPTSALRRICDILEADGGWWIVSVSSPGTILRDLDGPRLGVSRRHGAEYDPPAVDKSMWPETILLSRVGALHLLHPSMRRDRDRERSGH